MSENLNSNNIENDDFNLINEDIDYKDLITRLNEIKSTIALLEKTIFKYELFLKKYLLNLNENLLFFQVQLIAYLVSWN